MTKNKDLLENSNSKGVIIDYFGTNSSSYKQDKKPVFDTSLALKIIQNDPIVKAAIITLVDKTLESDWEIYGKDKRSSKSEAEDKLCDLRFNSVLRKIVFNLGLYGNAFIEIVKKGGKVTDLNVLETTFMSIISDDNGNITGYEQNIGPKKIQWTPDRIVHYKMTDITTNVWGDVDLQSVYETILLKEAIRNWMTWFFTTNQSRGMYNIKGANTEKVKAFLSYLKASEKDYGKPVIAEGEVVYSLLRNFAEEGKDIDKILSWCDSQILALLQVPPIAVGMPDASGRSNSVEQFKALNIRVNSIQNIIADVNTYDLFPKIGYDKLEFEFCVIDAEQMKRNMEVIVMMSNSGFTNEAKIEFLKEQGVTFETENVFNDPMEMAANTGSDPQGDMKPARMRQSDNQPNNVKNDKEKSMDVLKNSVEEEEELDQYKEVKRYIN